MTTIELSTNVNNLTSEKLDTFLKEYLISKFEDLDQSSSIEISKVEIPKEDVSTETFSLFKTALTEATPFEEVFTREEILALHAWLLKVYDDATSDLEQIKKAEEIFATMLLELEETVQSLDALQEPSAADKRYSLGKFLEEVVGLRTFTKSIKASLLDTNSVVNSYLSYSDAALTRVELAKHAIGEQS